MINGLWGGDDPQDLKWKGFFIFPILSICASFIPAGQWKRKISSGNHIYKKLTRKNSSTFSNRDLWPTDLKTNRALLLPYKFRSNKSRPTQVRVWTEILIKLDKVMPTPRSEATVL